MDENEEYLERKENSLVKMFYHVVQITCAYQSHAVSASSHCYKASYKHGTELDQDGVQNGKVLDAQSPWKLQTQLF